MRDTRVKVICEFCDEPLNPKAQGAYRQVLCWLEPGKSSGARLITDAAGWAHDICIQVAMRGNKARDQDETLF